MDCDLCALVGQPCPGQGAHCAVGEHCTTTCASCSMDERNDDHPATCEHCGADVR